MSSSIIRVCRRQIRPALLSGSRSISLSSTSAVSSATFSSQIPRGSNSSRSNQQSSSALLIGSSLALTYALSSNTANCESKPDTSGPADETEDANNSSSVVIQDGIDAGSETPTLHSLEPSDEVAEEDGDDDPSNDEETTCSICLINRQGPCRRYWLKFERCMKDHSAEKEKRENKESDANAVDDTVVEKSEDQTMEDEWDAFMVKSIKPGEEDEDEEGEDDEDSEEEDEDSQEGSTRDSETDIDNLPPSLGERCDKFMIPWISCIQEHRNVYSLISNAFYQKDYVDPLEDSVLEGNKKPFTKVDASIGEKDGYVVKFLGAEVDLGNWREHVEADAEESEEFLEDDEEASEKAAPNAVGEEPHLINAYAKFKLTEPGTGNPIEVAYIKDQSGRLLGFDSFSKRENPESPPDNPDEKIMHSEKASVHDGSTMEHGKVHDGECSFHIVPEETKSVAAYAIYRGTKVDEKGEEQRDYVLYYTPHIPLPGNQNDK